MRTLVVAEASADHTLPDVVRRVVTAATTRRHPVDLLVLDPATAAEAALIDGVDQVLRPDLPDASGLVAPESLAALLAELAPCYTLIAAAHRTLGRNALPRAAALTAAAFVADVTGITNDGRFVRGWYAGSIVATVESVRENTFATVRASSFAAAGARAEPAPIDSVAAPPAFAATTLVERNGAQTAGIDLANAPIVVSGGRGLASSENMARLGALASRVGAALGASRAAVDAGYAPNSIQVGQTGKIVAPDAYLAFGISGAVQHLAGMKDSKLIVAVNKDPDAPIFSFADVSFVGDLFDVMAALERHVEAGGGA
ncbi:electron transfer flavoprotein subunit alpha [Burkholderia sp. MSMB1459WGS]|uniref:electron transfer flavoprotein subunit alpha/FixB family protein n=1 Tax=unclassified Burkholderia TaxID=2613784 RepID=UPI0007591178|nr:MULTISPECIES: FAD-binding protein [unclassified Burkholderia]KVT06140.1 electron transfer flavoprotein subunit alpha [Burkholderia sp. MSMB1078WGS]KWO45604.1 electron transfer flavoprotein subunit alpha [Burkholderia sp. MSMB1459WGS]